jgi:hypothetical protein
VLTETDFVAESFVAEFARVRTLSIVRPPSQKQLLDFSKFIQFLILKWIDNWQIIQLFQFKIKLQVQVTLHKKI